MTPSDLPKGAPTYEQLLAENIGLRRRVMELESKGGDLAAEVNATRAAGKKPTIHKLDPAATDAFHRPAFSRR